MPRSLTRTEQVLLVAFLGLLALGLGGPFLAQPPHAHDFADQRALCGVPHALDVVSNLPFVIAGAWGLLLLRRAAFAGLLGLVAAVLQPTGELLSGHTLKHVTAAFAAAPVIAALRRRAQPQNARMAAAAAA